MSGVSAALTYARTLGISPEPRDGDVERRTSASGGEPRSGGQPAAPAAEQTAAPGAISTEDVTSPRAKSNLIALASSLGTDPDTLLAHVSSGQSIRTLTAGAEARYGGSVAPGGGIAIDQYV